MKDGMIELGTPEGMEIGFTNDLFEGWLWKKGRYIWISMIISKRPNAGNVERLFRNIQKGGFGIKVPTPLGTMVHILQKVGFKQTLEMITLPRRSQYELEVWIKKPPSRMKK